MKYIGCHLSSAKGYENMGKEALKIKANTFQFFTRNPRGGKAKEIDKNDIRAFLKISQENEFGKLVAHAPYTLNPCSKDQKVRNFAYIAMSEDMERMENLPGNYYNFHPGSHVGQGVETGIKMIGDLLNEVLTDNQSTTVLIETMAGKGSEIGKSFEEIAEILNKIKLNNKMGVCLDTCHVNDGGYNIVEDLEGVLESFDKIIGLDKLKAIHVNDSMNPLGAHKDRHAKIGEGHIGAEALKNIVNHPKLKECPFILETPNDLEGYGREIKLLRGEQ